MDSFGLGLMLSFTDNASSGMRRVSVLFNEMSGLADQLVESSNTAYETIQTLASSGIGLTIVGEQITQVGRTITGIVSGFVDQVNVLGSSLLITRNQLTALYASPDVGNQTMSKMQDFARKTIFTFDQVAKSVIMLKANGIEAFDQIATSSGEFSQNLLEYGADLAAFNPFMRNRYGTGINAAIGALNDYIAIGSKISLQRGASLDILGILGEEKGKTMEDRARQVADLMEKLNLLGFTAQMANTPMQRLARMTDLWEHTLRSIAELGVYDKYTNLIVRISDYLFDIPEEELQNLYQIVADTLLGFMKIADYTVTSVLRLADSVRTLAREHPAVAKMALTIFSLGGVALLVVGTLMKFAGSLFLLTSALTQMSTMSRRGTTVLGMFGRASGSLFLKLLPFVSLAGLMYVAWRNNLFNIRDSVSKIFKEIGLIVSLTFDALKDNTLSEDNFLLARDLGILPFIESLLILKYYWINFVWGFKYGFNQIFETIDQFVSKFLPAEVSVLSLTDKVATLLSLITGEEQGMTWVNFGVALGRIGAVLLIVLPLFKIFTTLTGVLTSKIGLVTLAIAGLYLIWSNNVFGIRDSTQALFDWISSIDWGSVWGVSSEIFSTLWSWVSDIASVLGIIVSSIVAEIPNIFAVIVALTNEVISWLFPIITEVGSFLVDLITFIVEVVSSALGMVPPIILSVGEMFETLLNIFRSERIQEALSWIVDLLIPLINDLREVFLGLVPIFQVVFSFIQTFVVGVVDAITAYILPVLALLLDRVFDFVGNVILFVSMLVSAVKPLIQQVVDWVQIIWDGWLADLVTNVIGFVARVLELFGYLAVGLYDHLISPLIDFVLLLSSILLPAISLVASLVVDAIMIIFNAIGGAVAGIVEILNGLIDFIVGVFTGDWERAWEGITSVFSGFVEIIESIFNAIVNSVILAINWVIRSLNLLSFTIPDWVPGMGGKKFGFDIEEIPYLNTGGEIKGEGVSYLHPNEVVVNSDLTKTLGMFLNDYKDHKGRSILPVVSFPEMLGKDDQIAPVPQQDPRDQVTVEGGNSQQALQYRTILIPFPAQQQQQDLKSAESSSQPINYDYSVTFEDGSIVLQVPENTTESDLEKLIDRIMQMIERKQQLRSMAVRVQGGAPV